jgi:replicative DNA helicase
MNAPAAGVRADEKLEAMVLGTWVSDERFRLAWKPEPDLFYWPGTTAIAEVFAQAFPARRWNEMATLAELEKRGKLASVPGGRQGLLELLATPVLPNPLADVDKLRELRALRNLRTSARAIEGAVDAGERLADVQGRMRDAVEQSIAGVGLPLVTGRELMRGLAEDLKRRAPITFCTFGLRELDAQTGGLRSGWVALIGSDTSWGKTSWISMLCDLNVYFGKRVLIVSTEDPLVAYRDRLLCRRAGVEFTRMRDRTLDEFEINRLVHEAEHLEDGLFYLSGEGVPVETLAGQIRAACAAHQINLVVFDYLHAAVAEKQFTERPREIAYIGRTITSAIKQARAAGILFAQLTMPTEGRRPTKEAIRDSKDLIKAAEIVLIGYYDRGERAVSVEKAKFGIKGKQLGMPWNDRTANFVDDLGGMLELREQHDDEAAA